MNLKKKNILLLIGFLLMLWVAYQFSFSKTLTLKKQYQTLKIEQELLSNVSGKLLSLKQVNIYYDSILKSKKISTENSFQNNLLQRISVFSDSTNISIVNFNTPHIFEVDNAIINTYSFTLKGDFSSITRLVFELEQEYKLGKIISVHFEKKKNYRRNSNYLEGTILLQKVDSK
ncbi:hypothetical protein [Aureibaculum luteum]|uniref:hypothetical protein n=1 Tax=Aureibaculum luteum TaxID=1548456 RepID=UPI000E494E3A|nr:hypothetical protein [Aureibaculum luteum]